MLKLALIANQTDSLEGFFDFFIENKNKIEKKAAQKFEITYIFNDSPENEVKAFLAARDVDLKVTDNYQQLVKNKEVDIIIELSRKFETADYLLQALKNKKQVITSNHKVLAENYLLIKEAEKKFRTRVFFSAVFSPLPLKTLLNNFYSLDEVKEINGVLNATTNFILSEMEKNTVSMKETVEQAKELSYTEENPEFDLSGRDSLNKSILLADLIYNTALDPSQVQAKGIKGITSYDLIYAAELGYKIKLISTIKKQDEKIYFGVRPNLVPENSFFSSLNDNSNGIELFSNYNSRTFIKAENNESAASNLFSQDLISAAEIISSQNDINFDLEALRANKIKLDDLYQQQANNFYVRLQLEKDKQIIEKIKDIFSEKNLADLILHDNLTETPLLPVIIITKKIKEKDLEELLKEVENLEGVLTVNNVIAVKTE
ncbi:homoserine dehydrogenase [Halanaerobium saccharolyticum]|uniref:Homoserine dehydrogenase n=1 Tax=Halanaerobium saccharolyticum TaxID=43595 RepID=A0A4R6S4H8_9FIRM|nr:homoserine dehydrogenase [Halanaerobium saccharolyticum]TDP94154.1 homoserine dehydrogenase [Halanaerobium saccharolyticum]